MNILLVNEDQIISKIVKLSLESQDIELQETNSLLRNVAVEYDLVIFDSNIYNSKVFKELSKITKFKKTCILLSKQHISLEKKCDFSITKPFLPINFINLVCEIGTQSLGGLEDVAKEGTIDNYDEPDVANIDKQDDTKKPDIKPPQEDEVGLDLADENIELDIAGSIQNEIESEINETKPDETSDLGELSESSIDLESELNDGIDLAQSNLPDDDISINNIEEQDLNEDDIFDSDVDLANDDNKSLELNLDEDNILPNDDIPKESAISTEDELVEDNIERDILSNEVGLDMESDSTYEEESLFDKDTQNKIDQLASSNKESIEPSDNYDNEIFDQLNSDDNPEQEDIMSEMDIADMEDLGIDDEITSENDLTIEDENNIDDLELDSDSIEDMDIDSKLLDSDDKLESNDDMSLDEFELDNDSIEDIDNKLFDDEMISENDLTIEDENNIDDLELDSDSIEDMDTNSKPHDGDDISLDEFELDSDSIEDMDIDSKLLDSDDKLDESTQHTVVTTEELDELNDDELINEDIFKDTMIDNSFLDIEDINQKSLKEITSDDDFSLETEDIKQIEPLDVDSENLLKDEIDFNDCSSQNNSIEKNENINQIENAKIIAGLVSKSLKEQMIKSISKEVGGSFMSKLKDELKSQLLKEFDYLKIKEDVIGGGKILDDREIFSTNNTLDQNSVDQIKNILDSDGINDDNHFTKQESIEDKMIEIDKNHKFESGIEIQNNESYKSKPKANQKQNNDIKSEFAIFNSKDVGEIQKLLQET
jgi:uncharacterized membrane protein